MSSLEGAASYFTQERVSLQLGPWGHREGREKAVGGSVERSEGFVHPPGMP